MFVFEAHGDETLVVEEVETENQAAIVKTHYCFAKKLVISGSGAAAVGSLLPVIVAYQDWQGNSLPDENRPIHVSVTGPGQAQKLVLTPVNGQAEFDFVSEVPGAFVIRATAEFPCDPAEVEVIVNE